MHAVFQNCHFCIASLWALPDTNKGDDDLLRLTTSQRESCVAYCRLCSTTRDKGAIHTTCPTYDVYRTFVPGGLQNVKACSQHMNWAELQFANSLWTAALEMHVSRTRYSRTIRSVQGGPKSGSTDSWPTFLEMDIKNPTAPCMCCYITLWNINVSKTSQR